MSEPDPFTGLIVTDAKGDLLPMVPIVDTRHWVSAAMAEIIVNMAAARWASPDRKRPTANRPVATRDQRLVLSAAIYRLLRNRSGQGLAAGMAVTSPALGRVATAKSELSTLLRAYVDDYWDYIKHRSIAPDNGPPGNGNRLGSFGYTLTQRAVQVLEALMQAVVVVVPVNRAQTPTVLTVQLPGRHLEADPMRGPAPPRAELGIDLLMPSADADRQIQVSLPDGVSLDLSGPRPPASMVIEVDPPPPLKDLADLMACLVEPGQEDLPAGDRQCLSDLAVAKAEAATETLRQDLLCLPAGAHSSLSITTATQDACIRLTGLQEELSNPPGADRQSTQQSLETLRALWGSGDWLRGPLRRRATADPLGPGTIVGRAGVIEDLTRRPTPRRARLYVRVEVTDAEFFSIARFAGVMSVILMTVVLAFLVIGAGRHRADSPSAEVLAGALTLFSAIQAGRIDHPDRSTLRGLLSAAGNWLVVASILPTIVLAVALAFNASGWTPVVRGRSSNRPPDSAAAHDGTVASLRAAYPAPKASETADLTAGLRRARRAAHPVVAERHRRRADPRPSSHRLCGVGARGSALAHRASGRAAGESSLIGSIARRPLAAAYPVWSADPCPARGFGGRWGHRRERTDSAPAPPAD